MSATYLVIMNTGFWFVEVPWRPIGDRGMGPYAGFLASDTAADVAALWPAETFKRLVDVKRTWDPDNIFRRNFNVSPD